MERDSGGPTGKSPVCDYVDFNSQVIFQTIKIEQTQQFILHKTVHCKPIVKPWLRGSSQKHFFLERTEVLSGTIITN